MASERVVKAQYNGKQWTLTIPKFLAEQMKLERGSEFTLRCEGDVRDPTIILQRKRP